MANRDHVDKLFLGVEKWNKWILEQQKKDLEFSPDLSNLDLGKELYNESMIWIKKKKKNGKFVRLANLRKIDFSHADLSNANLSGSDLESSFLQWANLENAIMTEVNLENADLSWSNLININFKKSNLSNVNLCNSNLKNANLSLVNLKKTNLKDSFMEEIDLTNANLEGANIANSNMSNADLFKANLKNSNCKEAIFKNANLNNANLKNSDLWCANLEKADLTEANLEKAILMDTNLKDTFLNNANLRATDFRNAELINANVSGVTDFNHVNFFGIHTGKFQGIRISSCYGSQLFRRYAHDQDFLEEYQTKHPVFYLCWWLFADCGRSFIRWGLWSFFFAFLFGFIFFHLGSEHFHFGVGITGATLNKNIGTYFYFSFITFTTLGFGDITPKTILGMTFVTTEVLLGYIMLGGLISIFANKLARRS